MTQVGSRLSRLVAVVFLFAVEIACSGGSGSSPASPSPAVASGTRVIALSGSLAFGSVQVGQNASATLTLTNSGNAPLTISSLTLPTGIADAFSASFTSGTIAAGASQQVNLKFSPTAARDYSGTLTVNGDQTSGANTIAISAAGVLAPGVTPTRVISVSGGPLAFGNVEVGKTASAVFTITNTGNSTLTITNMTIPGCAPGAFSASWTSGTIPPGGSQQVTQFYSPTTTGSCSGTLTVVGDQTSGTNTLPISGTGVPSSSPSPSPSPSPSGSTKYNGTYNLFYKLAGAGGVETNNLTNYLIIRNGVVSSRDGALSGSVDATFGTIRFTSICPYNNSQATWTGNMTQSAQSGSNFGQGQYSCANPGDVFTWQATQSGP